MYGIELEKIIPSVCHLQDEDKKYVMACFETGKQVYLLYQELYHSNT